MIVLHGAGLVVGLDTGEDPPPSEAREMVLEDMKRHNVPNPSKLLKSGKFAIVEIIGYLPPLIRKGEHFDVEVMLPAASKVKSLNGGHLLRDVPRRASDRSQSRAVRWSTVRHCRRTDSGLGVAREVRQDGRRSSSRTHHRRRQVALRAQPRSVLAERIPQRA